MVCDGLLCDHEGRWQLHPALMPWQKELLRRRRQWFTAGLHHPLSLLAAMMGVPAARLLVDRVIAGHQYWVVTPWHGQAVRDRVRLLPAALLEWQPQDSVWLQQQVQPLLDDLNMELMLQRGGALVMRCADPLQVTPLSYPCLEHEGLVNQHPTGRDGGKLMRLLAEVQMLLHQQPPPHRRDKPALHGIWLWGSWYAEADSAPFAPPAAGCRDPLLRQICDGCELEWLLGTAEEVVQMLPAGEGSLPAIVVLIGEGRAVVLSGRRWHLWGRNRGLDGGEVQGEEEDLWRMVMLH